VGEHLVVGGLYRYVRNVMYIAVTSAIIGQALLLGSAALADRYGAQYEEYRRAVPAWWPEAQRRTIAQLVTFASRPRPTPSVMRTTTLREPCFA
jgi:protein-S-isoprenylcysteine O-methyltransferase Ste14